MTILSRDLIEPGTMRVLAEAGQEYENIKSEALALLQDTVRIALKTAGYENVDNMDQFARASAVLDMAQEYNANRESLAHYEYVFDDMGRAIANVRKRDVNEESVAWANGRGYN